MDYSTHVCEQCEHKVHPANLVRHHVGKREFFFCSQEHKKDWQDDNMYYEPPDQLEFSLNHIGRYNE